MKFIDVVSTTQQAVSEILGTDYMEKTGDFAQLDSYKLADVGKAVESVEGGVDKFVKAVLVQRGKLYIESREYTSELSNIYVDSFDWGGYVERVMFKPQDLIQDEMYNLVDGASYDDHVFYEPKAVSKIFEEAKTIMCPISLTEDAIKMSFTSWDEMNKFLSGIEQNVRNTIDVGLDAYAHMLVACGIAVSDKAIGTSVHLLTEAIERGILEEGTTAGEAMESEAFITFAMRRIAETKAQMHRYSAAFNNHVVPIQAKDVNMILLNDFVQASKFLVKANTYNINEIGIGEHDTISAWQSVVNITGQDTADYFAFENNSKIKIKGDATNKLGCGTSDITIGNVIGIAYDRMAMGICPFKQKVTSSYTAIADFWNQYHHTLVNYILDSNYPMVAFIVD